MLDGGLAIRRRATACAQTTQEMAQHTAQTSEVSASFAMNSNLGKPYNACRAQLQDGASSRFGQGGPASDAGLGAGATGCAAVQGLPSSLPETSGTFRRALTMSCASKLLTWIVLDVRWDRV